MKILFQHLIESQARSRGDSQALVYKDQRVTYGELWDQVCASARGFRNLGAIRRDRVGIYLEKRVETVVSLFGAAAADCVFVPVNPVLRPAQVAYILGDCNAKILVTSQARLESLAPDLESCSDLHTVVVVDGPGEAPAGVKMQVVSWTDFMADGDGRLEPSSVDIDMAAILYTSGSTGMPKGVVLSHRNLMVGAESVSHYIGNTASDRILALLPLSFDAGLSQITTGFNVGATVVLMNYLLARSVVRMCEKERITGLTCVPPLWIKLAAEEWPTETGARMRYFANTGGHMPRPLLKRLRTIFPQADPYLMYGLTESFRSTYLDPALVDERPDSIGKAIPNAEVLVVREDGSDCDPDEIGELVHRGALVSMGYWNAPELTAERFKPAPVQNEATHPELAVWSGDLVRKDEQGFIYFVGRNDEMIKTSGYRVSPTEIEEVVFRTGLASEVAAVGIPDGELGQTIVVLAVPPDGGELDVEAITAECREQLPLYMVPRRILSRDSLPRNPNGKIDRPRLLEEMLRASEGHDE